MPVRSSYVQGTPNWIDLSATDQDAAKDFYGELFGWTFDDQPMPEGVYSMALKDDGLVGAISVQPPDLAAQRAPAMWNTYLAVDDVDAALARVDAAGGKTLMAAFDVTDAGRMAFIVDPTGAPLALWQAGSHIGATLVNETGSFIWNDLRTDDVAAAASFYEAVFGLIPDAQEWDEAPYVSLRTGADAVAGISARTDEEAPNEWQIYFAVDDTEGVTAHARSLGARVILEPTDTPIGPMATLADPQGAVFNVISIAALS
jgi:predicted enzyme related to lactoylglutathione lyase